MADARGPQLVFQIHQRGHDGYASVPADPEGFQHSSLFDAWFRVTRQTRKPGQWSYRVERRSH